MKSPKSILFLILCLESLAIRSQITIGPSTWMGTQCQQSFGDGKILADIKVASKNLSLSSVTLNYFDLGAGNTATVGLRISANNNFICVPIVSTNIVVTTVTNGIISIPAICTLLANKRYFIGFYVQSVNQSCTYPTFLSQLNDYYDDTQSIQISNTAHTSATDICPGFGLMCIPIIGLNLANPLSLDEKAVSASRIRVYPIPVENYLELSIDKEFPNDLESIRIYDCLGRLVRSETNPIINGVTRIEVSDLAVGSYYLKLGDDKEVQVSKKFFIAR